MNQVSIQTLETVPERALPFLRTIATNVQVREKLSACGYDEEEQAAGWRLLLRAVNTLEATLPATHDELVRAAIAELDRSGGNPPLNVVPRVSPHRRS